MSKNPKLDTRAAQAGLAGAVFECYHRELRRFLQRRASEPQDAGDLVQEVYVRLLSIERGTLVRNPQAYMYGIAAHVAREARLRLQRERVSFDSASLEGFAESSQQVWEDELTEGVSLERQVEEALAQLSPNHLKVLIADRRDGLSAEEIALKFGLSVHTVRKYLVQALAAVRASWNPQEDPKEGKEP